MRRNRSDDTETEPTSNSLLDGSRGSSAEPVPAGSKGLMDRFGGGSTDASSGGSRSLVDRVRGPSAEPPKRESGGVLDRAKAKYGLGTLLVVAGAGLFLFPEPVTSTAGVVLMAAGIMLWLLG